MSLIESLQQWTAITDNGAVTNQSSLNRCLDLFFIAWASRNMSEITIAEMFSLAYNEDQDLALKILFWARDIRWGMWERRFFHTCCRYLLEFHPQVLQKLVKYIPEYWTWKDTFNYLSDDTVALIADKLKEGDGLLAKRMPRKWIVFKTVRKYMQIPMGDFRRMLVKLTNVVETKMCNKDWANINYCEVPSVAFNNYKRAFARHDEDRFVKFITNVNDWTEKLNSSVLFPYHIYQSFCNRERHDVIQAQRDWLANYTWEDSILPVVDVSGSMSVRVWTGNLQAIDISISLWVYLAEHIKWPFKDCFISFEWRPRLHTLKGNIADRFLQTQRSAYDMSTNLIWVFEEIIRVAKRDNLSDDDLPKKVVVISDMEFNSCWDDTNYQKICSMYKDSGYTMPYIVFWIVNGRQGNVPWNRYDNLWLVSWASPSIIKSILSWDFKTPMELMLETINTKRYEVIKS